MNKLAIRSADGIVYLYKKILKLGTFLGISLLWLGKYTVLPSILFVYKNIIKLKLRTKTIKLSNINYVILVRKYLPSIIIIIIIISVTTNNIFAQNYSTDEYATRTLLSNILPSNEGEDGWSELIEETGPAINQIQVANYLENEGALQQLVVATPFEEDESSNTDTSPDSTSLVLLSPEDTEISGADIINQISRTKLIEYTVQSGDVIGKIAEKFGVSANTILWENSLTWNSTIRPGQKINILQDSGMNHEVISGDTVLAIAKKYQADASKIVIANKLADSSDISIGDLLFIPDGVRVARIVSSYTPPATNTAIPPSATSDTGTKLLWPLLSHRITQYYHWGHSGLDVGDKTGKPIYAAEAGKVERSTWSKGYGYNVIINHGNGIKTLYAHSSKLLVSVGDSVSRGQTIALIGNTGWSTGPHLHFEVRVNGVRQNPLNYIK